MVIAKFNLLIQRINLQIYSQSPWIKKDLIFSKMSWALLILKMWINSGSGLLTGLCINWLWINKLSGNCCSYLMCRQNLCVSLHHLRCFLGRQWHLNSGDASQWRTSTWKGSRINSDSIHYSQQNQHCMRIIAAGAVSGQGTQLVNVQQHVTQRHVGLACLKRRIFTVPRVIDLFVVNWSKSCSEYSLKISTASLLLCNSVSACICCVLQCSVLCLFVH